MKALTLYDHLMKFKYLHDGDKYEDVLRARIDIGVDLLKYADSYEEYMALNERINKDVDRLNTILRRKERQRRMWFQDGSERVIDDDEIVFVVIKNGQIGGHKIF